MSSERPAAQSGAFCAIPIATANASARASRSPRSDAAPWVRRVRHVNAEPGASSAPGSLARSPRAAANERVHRAQPMVRACAWPSSSPTPEWPRAGPSEELVAEGRVTSATRWYRPRDGCRREPAAWRSTASCGRATSPRGLRAQQAGGRGLHRPRHHGRPTVVDLVPSALAAVPGGTARRGLHRADPADQRRRAGQPAHAPSLRVTRPTAPRARPPLRRRRSRPCGTASGWTRADRPGPGAPLAPEPAGDHDPRGTQASGAADVRGGGPLGALAPARGLRSAAPRQPGGGEVPAAARRRGGAAAALDPPALSRCAPPVHTACDSLDQ